MPVPPFRHGQVIRARGESWIVHRHIPGARGSILEVRGRDRQNLGTQTSFLLPCERIERLQESSAPRMVRPRTWRRLVRARLATSTPSYDVLRSPVRARLTILPYQLEPALAIVRGLASRVLIADEVGLGKTIQAGHVVCELLERRPDSRVLIVSPAGLREQWTSELRERFGLEAAILDSAALARFSGAWNANPWSAFPVVVTSLDYVKRPEVARSLESLVWDVVVFDEAHALSGRSARASVAAELAQRARTLVLLTATPHSGDEDAFTRLCAIGDLSGHFPLIVFRRTRGDVGLPSSRRTTSLRVRTTPEESQMHRALMSYVRLVWYDTSHSSLAARLAMTMLMRRACSSASSLAKSVETRLRALASGEGPDLRQMTLPFSEVINDDLPGAELVSPGLADRREECAHLERLLDLARSAVGGESKLRALRRFLRRAAEPAIVFTEYRDTLNRIAEFLHDSSPIQLHGGLTTEMRQEVLHQFASGRARLLLATDAASEGLNLHQHCRLVINLELPWTPVRLEQRIGRVERIGQARRVHAIHLLAADTCEESSVATFLARLRTVEHALGGMRGTSAIEHHIAGTVVSGQDAREAIDDAMPGARALPAGVTVGHLRAAGHEEATRLETARAFARGAIEVFGDGRAPVTVARRRRQASQCCCAFQLEYEDAGQQPIWDTLVGLTGPAKAGHCVLGEPGSITAARVREWIQSASDLTMPLLAGEAQRVLHSLAASIQARTSLAIRRELAIADALEARRARLSAGLLQPGLFDRRAERAVTAQNAVLDEALARCAARLQELERSGRLTACPPRLAFSLIAR